MIVTRNNIRYISGQNEEISFSTGNIIYLRHNFSSYAWNAQTVIRRGKFGGAISMREVPPITYKMIVQVFGESNKNLQDSITKIQQVFESDMSRDTLGRLYVDEWFVECNVVSLNADVSENVVVDFVEMEINILAPGALWQREKIYTIINPTSTVIGKKHLYKYPYKYSTENAVTANIEGPLPAAIKIEFFGACTSPELTIGQNIYRVAANAELGERIVIDGLSREIYKAVATGEHINLFDLRDKSNSPFALLPAGVHAATRAGAYNIVITVYEQRTSPDLGGSAWN